MNINEEKLINQLIALTLALKVFIIDRDKFKNSYAESVYLDMLDSVIESINNDLNLTKEELFNKYHVIVTSPKPKENPMEYRWQKQNRTGVLTFTPKKLRELTRRAMSEYLTGTKAKQFPRKSRVWTTLNLLPPEIDHLD